MERQCKRRRLNASTFPEDAWFHILQHCDATDLPSLRKVCRTFRDLVDKGLLSGKVRKRLIEKLYDIDRTNRNLVELVQEIVKRFGLPELILCKLVRTPPLELDEQVTWAMEWLITTYQFTKTSQHNALLDLWDPRDPHLDERTLPIAKLLHKHFQYSADTIRQVVPWEYAELNCLEMLQWLHEVGQFTPKYIQHAELLRNIDDATILDWFFDTYQPCDTFDQGDLFTQLEFAWKNAYSEDAQKWFVYHFGSLFHGCYPDIFIDEPVMSGGTVHNFAQDHGIPLTGMCERCHGVKCVIVGPKTGSEFTCLVCDNVCCINCTAIAGNGESWGICRSCASCQRCGVEFIQSPRYVDAKELKEKDLEEFPLCDECQEIWNEHGNDWL